MSRYLRVLDGSMGDLLSKRGLPHDQITWGAKSILDAKYHPMVTQCHLDYLRAGSRTITTNNYALRPITLEHINEDKNTATLTKTAVNLAMNARNTFYNESDDESNMVYIAGSIPPLQASYRPDMILSETECKYWYGIIINALHESNVDIFLCETMSCLKECKYALDVIENVNRNKKCWIAFTLNEEGLVRSNENLNDIIKQLTSAFMSNKNIEIIGMNCCTPESIDKALAMLTDETIELLNEFNINIGVYGNGWEEIGNNWQFTSYKDVTKALERKMLTPQTHYDIYVQKWLKQYPWIGMIGGCCGVFPPHIEYMVDHIQNDFPEIRLSPIATKAHL